MIQINAEANRILDEIYAEKGIDYCEIQLSPNCLKKEKHSYGERLSLSYAHRHKRIWYRGDNVRYLSDFMHTIRACLHCHRMIEDDRKLSEKVFSRLRNRFLLNMKKEEDEKN